MGINVLVLFLTGFVVVTNSHPLSFVVETGVNSDAKVETDGKTGAGVGWDGGPTVEGKAKGVITANWLKRFSGRIYIIDSKGEVHGVSASIGSLMAGTGVGEAKAKAGTIVVSSKADGVASVKADGSYKAGVDIHFMDKSEVMGVPGVTKPIVKASEEIITDSKQLTEKLEESNQVDREAKAMEGSKNEGYIKSIWKKYIGK